MLIGLILVVALACLVRYVGPAKKFWQSLPPKARVVGVPLVGLALAVMVPGTGFIPGITTQADGWLPQTTLVYCAIYALFSMGLNIVVGYAGLLDLGYVAFFLFGAYVAAWLMSDFWYGNSVRVLDGLAPSKIAIHGLHFSFWLVMIAAAIVAAIAGLVIGAPTLRLKSDYLALVTLGFGEILPEIFRNGDNFFGTNVTNGTSGIGPLDPIGVGFLKPILGGKPRIAPADFKAKYYVILFFCVLFVYVSLRLRGGKLGRAWLAIREDELAASLMGVPLMRTKLWSYAIGAAAGGLAGTFYATTIGIVNVDTFQFSFSIIILCAVILGGMGNVWGAILGGVVITWFNYTGLVWLGDQMKKHLHVTVNLKQYEFGFFGIILVLMMLFRPQGLLPAARQKQVKELEKTIEAKPVQA